MRTIRVGSRDSKLAVMQTQIVLDTLKQAHPELEFELVTLKTTGDLILDKTLDKIGGKGLFVKELDQALMDGRVDMTVHSLKDMPMEENPDLPVVAYSTRGDPRDALVLAAGHDPEKPLAVIGSSSARRQIQLAKLFPGVAVHSMRGNIITRLEKLDRGECSALVLAASGLMRAGLSHRITRPFSVQEMLPAAGQGILAVQCRRDFDAGFLIAADDPASRAAAMAERGFVRTLDGGCSSPIAAFAQVNGHELRLTGLYVDPQTGRQALGSMTDTVEHAALCGERLAIRLKGQVE